MSQLTIRHADSLQRRTAGPLTAAHIFRKSRRDLAKTPLWIVRYEDDVEPYDADYLVIEKVLVAVRRYVSQPGDQFTIWVDEARAREEGFHPMQLADALLAHLQVNAEDIVWSNVELAEEP